MADRLSNVKNKKEKTEATKRKNKKEVEEKYNLKESRKRQGKHSSDKKDNKKKNKVNKKDEIEKIDEIEKVEKIKEKTEDKDKNENELIEVNDSKDVTKEGTSKPLTKREQQRLAKQLKAIKEEIKEETSLPIDKAKKIYIRMFINIVLAEVITIFFAVINTLKINLVEQSFMTVLQISSIVTIAITIIMYEIAYKKDSGKLTIYGIEAMILSMSIVVVMHVYKFYSNNFKFVLSVIILLFILYYIVKIVSILFNGKRKTKREIIEKEKEETR